jgi:hypothetical protein
MGRRPSPKRKRLKNTKENSSLLRPIEPIKKWKPKHSKSKITLKCTRGETREYAGRHIPCLATCAFAPEVARQSPGSNAPACNDASYLKYKARIEKAGRSEARDRIERHGLSSSAFNRRTISRYGCECFQRMTFEEYRRYTPPLLCVRNSCAPRYERSLKLHTADKTKYHC